MHPKELNPYWNDGGTGLPTTSNSNDVRNSIEGRSWILRSYKRALEEAKNKKVSFREVAERRWGSVDKIYSMLQSVGIDPAAPDECERKNLLYSHFESRSVKIDKDKVRSHNYDDKIAKTNSSECFVRPGDISDIYTSKSRGNWQREDLSKKNREESHEVDATESSLSVSKTNDLDDNSVSLQSVTDSMINAVSAKIIRAELVGKKDKMLSLQLELEDLRSRKRLQDDERQLNQNKSKNKTVLLTQTDQFGRIRPAHVPYGASSNKSIKGKSKFSFQDASSTKELIYQEKLLTADDTYEAIAIMAAKFVHSSSEDIVDDVVDMSFKTNPKKENEKAMQKIISHSRKMEEILENCKYCLGSSNRKEHVLVAMGMNAYLSVPVYQSLTRGHCLLVPTEHTTCSLQLDENVWSEIKIFQKGLTKMFSDYDMDVVFSECFTASKSHMYIDCIPIPKDKGNLAPMYFKKAILESDTEWAQNKKLIDTRQKNVRGSLPLGLPYFFVDFNNEGGFGHVIEDLTLFPKYFAKEIIGGLIDADPRLWLKPPQESVDMQKKKASQLIKMWKPYDWTDELHFKSSNN